MPGKRQEWKPEHWQQPQHREEDAMDGKQVEMKQERERNISILAHSIAAQAAAVEGITYKGALNILDRAKFILERQMEDERATVPQVIHDMWGSVIEKPQE